MSGPGTSEDEPVTAWIESLRNGDPSAVRRIWEHFVLRLSEAVRHRICPETRRVYDEEDVALSALNSFCAGVAAGRFPNLNDRESLWRLMLVIASRKVTRRHRYDHQQRRDVRRNLEESLFSLSADGAGRGMDQFASREPSPELQAEFVETAAELFQSLPESRMRDIAQLRFEGFNDTEIALRLGCSRQAVQRSIERIRRNWLKCSCLSAELENDRAEVTQPGIGGIGEVNTTEPAS